MLRHIDYFNKAAPTYDDQASVQQKIGNQLISYLPALTADSRIIDLGCGTGLVTVQLAQHATYAEFTALDLAERLLLIAKQRLAPFGCKLQQADFNHFNTPTPYDLVFSNMALHWSNNFNHTLHIIKNLLAKHGSVAFSVPLQNTFIELKPYFAIHRFMRHDDILQNLLACDYRIRLAQQEIIEEKFTDTLSALRSLKYTGVNFCAQRPNKSLKRTTFPTTISKLTYHIGYYIIQHA